MLLRWFQFQLIKLAFWKYYYLDDDLTGFCKENEWEVDGEFVSIRNQEEHVKSKNISEKITFESKFQYILLNIYELHNHNCFDSILIDFMLIYKSIKIILFFLDVSPIIKSCGRWYIYQWFTLYIRKK